MNNTLHNNHIETSIANVLNGNPDAFADIVKTHEPGVRAIIAAMIPDSNMIADVSQEAFVIAYQRLSTYQPGTNFKAWLHTIARNAAQNERRRWYGRRDMQNRYHAEIEKRMADDITKVTESLPEDTLAALRSCMDNLGGKTRALMDGFYFHEHAVKELAKSFALSVNAVKVTLHRARLAMGKCLQRKGRQHA
ncbi:MAG: sigma-70 family RNA polymerase sigma factor [Lentisphaerae bacterium]|nr:sigma-70 family RNA polymerase sigma factor [Lentisphaerota bacterium]